MERYKLEDKALTSLQNLFLRLIVTRFKRLCHYQPDLNILFVKLTAQKGDCIEKTPSAYYTSEVGDFMQNLYSFLIS